MEEEELLRSIMVRTFSFRAHTRYGAHSIGIGMKRVGGKFTDKPALIFVVPCKLSEAELSAERRVPSEMRFVHPGTGEETTVTTDVVAFPAPELHALPPGATHRPVPGGVRCLRPSTGDVGTLGGWVWDKRDDSIVFLSNQHVIGDVPDDPIHQGSSGTLPPGETLRIGVVKRAAGLTIVSGSPPYPESQCNYADAAIGSADDSDDISLTVLEVGPAVYETKQASLFQNVEKFGQITLHQQGMVTIHSISAAVPYPGVGTCGICDAFQVEPVEENGVWSAKGDSGALVFERDPSLTIKPCVGLHFAGGGTATAGNNYGTACRIGYVFDELDLDVLCGGGFAAFLDALMLGDEEDITAAEAAALFTSRRASAVTPRFTAGLARDVQAHLLETEAGRVIADFVHMSRGELMQMLVSNGDVRRAAIHALRPVLRNTVTVDQLFDRKLTTDDVSRLKLLVDTTVKSASGKLQAALQPMRALLKKADGAKFGDILSYGAKKKPGKKSDKKSAKK
jgi:hypothetical protein